MIKIALIEDDQQDYYRLKKCLDKYSQEKNIQYNLTHFTYAELFLENYKPVYDLVFMDIELCGMNGMDAAKRFRALDKKTLLIFLTNMSQYAIKGYEVHAMDFVLKPINYYSIAMRLDNVAQLLKTQEDIAVTIRLQDSIRVVFSKNIYYIDIMKHDMVFHTNEGEISAYGNLSEREKQLLPYNFVRCSACALVNLRYVEGIYGDDIRVAGEIVHISRGKRKAFLTAFNSYLGESNLC